MISISIDQARQRYTSLSPLLKNAIFSPQTAEVINRLGEEAHLSADKVLAVAKNAGYVLLGFIHPDELPAQLKEAAGIPQEVAETIGKSLSARVFGPLTKELDSAYAPLHVEAEKDAPVILASIGETSAPPKIKSPIAPPVVSAPPLPVINAAPAPLAMDKSAEKVSVLTQAAPAIKPLSPAMPTKPVPASDSPESFAIKIEVLRAKEKNSSVQLPATNPVAPVASARPAPLPPPPRPNLALPVSPLPSAPRAMPPISAPEIKPPIMPPKPVVAPAPFAPKPNTTEAAPLPMMMHENLSTQPVSGNPDLHMGFAKQNIISGMGAERPRGIPPKPAQLEIGVEEKEAAPQVVRTTPVAPRVVNYSASKPEVGIGGIGSPIAGALGSPFSKPQPAAPAPSIPVPPPQAMSAQPPKLDPTPPYKPLASPPLAPSFPPQPPKSLSSSPLPPLPPGTPSPDATVRHESFVDLTHLDKK